MNTLRDTTLIFLVKKTNGTVSEICLAMKKRSFGKGRWNGVGGKVMPPETIEEAARREAKEEIGADLKEMQKVAEMNFYFSNKPDWDQCVHAYFCEQWDGTPTESEEMAPQWFKISDIPFDKMWPDDIFWLPKVLEGNLVKASFTFGEGETNPIEKQDVQIVQSL